LFGDLLERVPTGRAYVNDCLASGREVVFDHGALRTVALEGMGSLPAGEAAIHASIVALGYGMNDVYPLGRLGMTGRAYTHEDHPEVLPQFFVSELHPERFSPAFLESVRRVTASSVDPLTAADVRALELLQEAALVGHSDGNSSDPQLTGVLPAPTRDSRLDRLPDSVGRVG